MTVIIRDRDGTLVVVPFLVVNETMKGKGAGGGKTFTD